MIIVPELSQATPRYLYFRSEHVNTDIFDPSTNGDSTARWDGDTLVVDTVGFHETHGLTAVPGGGYRTPTSHLVERYSLLQNGAILSVTSTWTDPKMFAAPTPTNSGTTACRPSTRPRYRPAAIRYHDVRSTFLEGTPGRSGAAVPATRKTPAPPGPAGGRSGSGS